MEHKYKIVKTDGCIAFGFEVNGKSLYGQYDRMTQEEEDAFTEYLLNKIKEEVKAKRICLTELVECLYCESHEDDGVYCDQCGDTMTTTTWNI